MVGRLSGACYVEDAGFRIADAEQVATIEPQGPEKWLWVLAEAQP